MSYFLLVIDDNMTLTLEKAYDDTSTHHGMKRANSCQKFMSKSTHICGSQVENSKYVHITITGICVDHPKFSTIFELNLKIL